MWIGVVNQRPASHGEEELPDSVSEANMLQVKFAFVLSQKKGQQDRNGWWWPS